MIVDDRKVYRMAGHGNGYGAGGGSSANDRLKESECMREVKEVGHSNLSITIVIHDNDHSCLPSRVESWFEVH
jgi:hypothetical protein